MGLVDDLTTRCQESPSFFPPKQPTRKTYVGCVSFFEGSVLPDYLVVFTWCSFFFVVLDGHLQHLVFFFEGMWFPIFLWF